MITAEHDATEVSVLYRQYAPLLRNIAIRKFKVPAQDAGALVHDVFVGYLRARHSVREDHKWLVGAVCNASRNYWRQHRESGDFPDGPTDVAIERLHALVAVHAVLERLEARCRDLLREHYLSGYSASEMADRRGTTTGYAEQLIHKCLKTARRMVRKELS